MVDRQHPRAPSPSQPHVAIVAPGTVLPPRRFTQADVLSWGFDHVTLSGRDPARGRQGWFGWNATWAGVAKPAGHLSLHFYRSGYVGVLVFGDGLANVCALTRRRLGQSTSWGVASEQAFEEQPALERLLRGAERISPVPA